MHVLDVGTLLVDAAAFAVLLLFAGVVGATVLTTMVVRRLRRRWHALKGSMLGRRYVVRSAPGWPARGDAALLTTAMGSASRLASPSWWSTQQARRRMWHAVTAASHAVKVAGRSGAPVGDLPTLVRQLEAAARSADALARADADRPSTCRSAPSGTSEVGRVEEAALRIHEAAVASLRSVATAEVDPLLPAARLEAEAIAAGVRAAAAAHRRW